MPMVMWFDKLTTFIIPSSNHGRRNRGVWGGHCSPIFEARGYRGTMKMMYSSQFRLYSGVRRGSILFHLLSVHA